MRKDLRRFARFLLAFALLLTLLPAAAFAAGEASPAFDGYIIKLADGAAPVMTLNAEGESALPDGMEELPLGYYRVDSLDTLAQLGLEDALDHIEPDYRMELMAVPDDPYYTNGSQWNLDQIDMSYAWANGIDGAGVTVGVIDSGLVRDHEDMDYDLEHLLYGGLATSEENFTPDTAETIYSADIQSHGTLVASVIAAATHNGLGVAGVAPGAKLMPLRMYRDDGTGTTSTAGCALKYAVDNGCQVVNMSVGVFQESEYLKTCTRYAAERGVIVVASAGNGNKNKTDDSKYTDLCYPAVCEGVIGVAALQKAADYTADHPTVTRASYSQKNISVDITAPGSGIWGLNSGDLTGYRSDNGTSFSSPTVAAAIALCKQQWQSMTAEDFMTLVRWTALQPGGDTPTGERTDEYGYGMLNVSTLLRTVDEGFFRAPATLAEGEGETVQVTADALILPGVGEGHDQVMLLAAAYDGEGRLMASQVGEPFAPGETRTIHSEALDLGLTELPAKVETLLIDAATWAPLLSPCTWTASP